MKIHSKLKLCWRNYVLELTSSLIIVKKLFGRKFRHKELFAAHKK